MQITGSDAADVLEHFACAAASCANQEPCLIFIDDAHVIFPVSDGASDLDMMALAFTSSVRLLRTQHTQTRQQTHTGSRLLHTTRAPTLAMV